MAKSVTHVSGTKCHLSLRPLTMRRLAFIVLLYLGLIGGSTAASAEKRVALVVGNANYVHVARLDNPANDARLMAGTLRDLGFALIGDRALIDLDKAAFDGAVQLFGKQLQGADVGLFYYAGHGIQVRGANYLVPVGANPTREADIDFEMLDIALVLRQMEAAGTRLNLVILDACRNNPFKGRGLRAATGGLAQIVAPEGTLISFATQPGNVALDGYGEHSPYTRALAETIQRPGLDIFRTFNEVGLAVKRRLRVRSSPGCHRPQFRETSILPPRRRRRNCLAEAGIRQMGQHHRQATQKRLGTRRRARQTSLCWRNSSGGSGARFTAVWRARGLRS